ncbi:MAG: hypothetical protein COU30_01540, partial [Candidatus Magasanikbacteria bacterium CG10_big_fil_rev_8_21_14_0_10_38_6]
MDPQQFAQSVQPSPEPPVSHRSTWLFVLVAVLILFVFVVGSVLVFRWFSSSNKQTDVSVEQPVFGNITVGDSRVEILKEDPIPDDRDRDGLTTEQEQQYGTDEYEYDTDGDGLSDLEEVQKYHTDPTNPDTDGDGF